jgi:hypothetical protein
LINKTLFIPFCHSERSEESVKQFTLVQMLRTSE